MPFALAMGAIEKLGSPNVVQLCKINAEPVFDELIDPEVNATTSLANDRIQLKRSMLLKRG